MINELSQEQLAALLEEFSAVRATVARLEVELAQVSYDFARLAPTQMELLGRIDGAEDRVGQSETAVEDLAAAIEGRHAAIEDRHAASIEDRHTLIERLERAEETVQVCASALRDIKPVYDVWTTMTWIAQADIPEHLAFSVIIPTRNRRGFLEQAIESVRAQEYSRWQIVIVDDGSDDDTPAFLRTLDDGRIVTVRTDGVGVAAARNRGLAVAAGDVIAYLDDDNRMHPAWLRSVAWAFAERPDADVLYGARIIDDEQRVKREGSGGMPWLVFHPYSRVELGLFNPADTNVVAHRAGLAEGFFDESLSEFADWEQLIRLTRDKPPVVLPALACFYTTAAPNRLSRYSLEELARLRQKHGLPDVDPPVPEE